MATNVPTGVVPAPTIRKASTFPARADRQNRTYNTKAEGWATSSVDMAADMESAAQATESNAKWAQMQATASGLSAQAAESTRQQALQDISTAKGQALTALTQSGAAIVADAGAARDAAAQSKSEAAASAAAAVGVLNYKGEWSTLAGPLAAPATVSHALQLWSLVTPTAAVQADEPGVSTKWIIVRERAPVGTVYTGTQLPREGVWLEMDALYLKASYPALAAQLGPICSGKGIDPVSTAWPFPGNTGRSVKVFDGRAALLAVADGGSLLIARSTNEGMSWSAATVPNVNQFTISAGASGNGVDLLLGSYPSELRAMRSGDGGVSWTQVNLPSGLLAGAGQLRFVNGKFYAWSAAGKCCSSETANDPAAWQLTAMTLDGAAMVGTPIDITYSPDYGKFLGVLAINSVSRLVSSTDGVAWVTVYVSPAYVQQICVAQRTVLMASPISGTGGALLVTSSDLLQWRTRLVSLTGVGGWTLGKAFPVASQVCFVGGGSSSNIHPAVLVDSALNVMAVPSKMGLATPTELYGAAGRIWVANAERDALQKAPLWDYDRGTQFRTPIVRNGVFGAAQWIKAK